MRGLLGVSEAAGILGTEGLFVWYLGALRSAVVCFSEFRWSITGIGVRGRYLSAEGGPAVFRCAQGDRRSVARCPVLD